MFRNSREGLVTKLGKARFLNMFAATSQSAFHNAEVLDVRSNTFENCFILSRF
jgi:hypothetical protein